MKNSSEYSIKTNFLFTIIYFEESNIVCFCGVIVVGVDPDGENTVRHLVRTQIDGGQLGNNRLHLTR